MLLALTSSCSLGLCVRRRGRGLDPWHVVMGLGLVVMLLTPMVQWSAAAQMVVFALGAAWCVASLIVHVSAGHARLLVACTAMVTMLAPSAFAPAVAAMPDMSPAATPTWLVTALVAALAVVAASALRTAVLAPGWPTRLSTCCEAFMALSMAWLLI